MDLVPDLPTQAGVAQTGLVRQGSGTERVDNFPATGTLGVGRGPGVGLVLDEQVRAWDASSADGAISDSR